MKIAHINLFDQYGGAARIANDIIQASRQEGHEVLQFIHRPAKPSADIVPIPFFRGTQILRQKEAAKGLTAFFSNALLPVFSHPFFREADVVHLHCINGGYFSYYLLPFLGGKALVWTMHDTLAMTANCLHPHRCDRWKKKYCENCPLDLQLPEGQLRLRRKFMQELKEKIIQTMSFSVVAPSYWLEGMLQQSIFKSQDIRMIHNGIHTDVFFPRDKQKMRQELGLPEDKKIILFAAHGGFQSGMKGGRFFLQALQLLQEYSKDYLILEIGGTGKRQEALSHIPMQCIPYVHDAQLMAKYYAAADVFISTSLSESFGLTVCESLACGTPVLSFAVGGIPEIVEHGKSGVLVPLGNVELLARRLREMLMHPDFLRAAGQYGAQKVAQSFSVERMTTQYLSLYKEIVK
ncbi:MAG: glycosyltransferase [Negativicutes bacterium]|nr:glycosyltransferase [Negativicutes bacterium]